ncbi:MAG TPA: hypothetical protein VEW03_07925, partial [Longimicrobiaceae bacterium]|nr:hypothetical protein [Longimicrobiaceae bacterium]
TLSYVAHSVTLGREVTLVGCSMVSGSAVVRDGAWLGPNASINQHLVVGEHCYIGTGSVVTRNLPPHALAYGSPAKVRGWVCSCHAKLEFSAGAAVCERCQIGYTLEGELVTRTPGMERGS